ncbi:hypothetical protein Ddye_000167 [Dipteronia dyeriana]|uniref:Uncharacterized protein n=1 Tax=Dipteronia dyeriana TaxID=168575 RepID=A0AAD9XLQ3_9ROSI|nr:hypothetical protein Ddye_000167 [Dipteronia dyeriana]
MELFEKKMDFQFLVLILVNGLKISCFRFLVSILVIKNGKILELIFIVFLWLGSWCWRGFGRTGTQFLIYLFIFNVVWLVLGSGGGVMFWVWGFLVVWCSGFILLCSSGGDDVNSWLWVWVFLW